MGPFLANQAPFGFRPVTYREGLIYRISLALLSYSFE